MKPRTRKTTATSQPTLPPPFRQPRTGGWSNRADRRPDGFRPGPYRPCHLGSRMVTAGIDRDVRTKQPNVIAITTHVSVADRWPQPPKPGTSEGADPRDGKRIDRVRSQIHAGRRNDADGVAVAGGLHRTRTPAGQRGGAGRDALARTCGRGQPAPR
ncbi:hypothetical protein GCM10009675_17090 [Prauserella alba]|uniref:Uncharacterized protein n=1 Tax=Prauserella alba TaxID=176898 RepID=A0ABP4FUD8_9PSEU